MIYKITIFLFLFVLSSCAQANYQDPNLAAAPQAQGSCSLVLTQSQLCIDLVWDNLPTNNDTGSFHLLFYQQNNTSVRLDPPYTLAVQLWMPSMGHGSSPVKIQKRDTGIFDVTNVFFVMPGEWEIRIQIKNGSSLVDQAIQKITI